MSNTPQLALPYLAANQAQKHVTLNEALSLIDGLLHLSVLSRVLTTPSAAAIDGDRYLIPTGAAGEWTTHIGQIAQWVDGAWLYHSVKTGWRLWLVDEAKMLIYNGVVWIESGTPAALQNLTMLGVNATADASNKLVVAAANTLFNHAGNGHQLKINKNTAGDTASLVFQTNYSGRAEFGLAGNDDVHLKVSPDGSTWTEALVINASTGLVTLTAESATQISAARNIFGHALACHFILN